MDPGAFDEAWRNPVPYGATDLYKRLDPFRTAYSDVPGAYPETAFDQARHEEAQERYLAPRTLAWERAGKPSYDFSRGSKGTW